MGQIGDDCGVHDEFTVHLGRLAVVQHLGGTATAKVLRPGRAGQGVELVVNDVRADGDRVLIS